MLKKAILPRTPAPPKTQVRVGKGLSGKASLTGLRTIPSLPKPRRPSGDQTKF